MPVMMPSRCVGDRSAVGTFGPALPRGPARGWRPRERVRIWLEGIEMGAVEIYLDGKLITRAERPPYLLGSEDRKSDHVIRPGEHELRIRAKDGQGWLEQTTTIRGSK